MHARSMATLCSDSPSCLLLPALRLSLRPLLVLKGPPASIKKKSPLCFKVTAVPGVKVSPWKCEHGGSEAHRLVYPIDAFPADRIVRVWLEALCVCLSSRCPSLEDRLRLPPLWLKKRGNSQSNSSIWLLKCFHCGVKGNGYVFFFPPGSVH